MIPNEHFHKQLMFERQGVATRDRKAAHTIKCAKASEQYRAIDAEKSGSIARNPRHKMETA
jgi:hypothetical protein